MTIKVVMLGDVMGEPGLAVLEECLPPFVARETPDFVMVNGENSAGGFGINEDTLKRMLALGVDAISSGNHIWEKRDFWSFLDSEPRLLRPANYPDSPGRGWIRAAKDIRGKPWDFLAINLQGREFLGAIDCPFRSFDFIINTENDPSAKEKPVVLVDFHAESSREKEAFGFYVDGRASVVAGTHTHVQTADEKILPKGTAYISDLGMTGVSDGVIGMEPKICVDRVRNQVLYRMEAAADGESAQVQGIIAEIDETGKALSIRRLKLSRKPESPYPEN